MREPEQLKVRVVATYPHDTQAFTQGLLWHDGSLYESTGQRGQSTVRQVNFSDGSVTRQARLSPALFAEGLTRVNDQLIQLTWTAGRAIVWNLERLEPLKEHRYEGEGWGLCFDGSRIVMSDGSPDLTFRDPESFEVLGRVVVRSPQGPVRRLNELECVDGAIYANIWMSDRIVRIDPATGFVTAWIDARGLLPAAERSGGEDVLNGIAHRPGSNRFFLTGKLWPKLFEVEFEAAAAGPQEPR